jgi:hypothetical protein
MKDETILDQIPWVCERTIKLCDQGLSIKEAIEQAKKEYEGVKKCQQ